MHTAKIILILVLIFSYVSPVKAKELSRSCFGTDIEWGESRTQSFAIIYPIQDENQEITDFYRTVVEQEYRQLEALFTTSLQLPINIRLYPRETHFYCLNSQVSELTEGFDHTHVGSREIAIITQNLAADRQDWKENALNALRHELAIFFTDQITDRKAPPGFITGIGGYAEDPYSQQKASSRAQFSTDELPSTWHQIWMDPEIEGDGLKVLKATSIVAYLVDVYGWPKLIKFMQAISTTENYREALKYVYHVDMGTLQDKWLQYFPFYLEGRWQNHAIYHFDLSAYDELLKAGAYTDAADGLKSVIDFLMSSPNKEKLAEAQTMLQTAVIGQEAAAIVRQARQALQDKQYESCISLATEAKKKYQSIGDGRRIEEIEVYQNWAQEVLNLRKETAKIQAEIVEHPTTEVPQRLVEIGNRLAYLGDEKGVDEVNTIFVSVSDRNQERANLLGGIGILLALILSIYKVITLHRRPHPEVLL